MDRDRSASYAAAERALEKMHKASPQPQFAQQQQQYAPQPQQYQPSPPPQREYNPFAGMVDPATAQLQILYQYLGQVSQILYGHPEAWQRQDISEFFSNINGLCEAGVAYVKMQKMLKKK